MPNYQDPQVFNHVVAPLIFDLPATDLDTAENVAAGIRYEVEQGIEVNAPVVTARALNGSAVALEPGRIVSIDLREVDVGG